MNLPTAPSRETTKLLQLIAEALRNNYQEDGSDCDLFKEAELDLEYLDNISRNIPAIVEIDYIRIYDPKWDHYNTIVRSCEIQYAEPENRRKLTSSEIVDLELYLLD